MTTVLRRLRLQRGQSLRELAREVGISHVTLMRLELQQQCGCHPRNRASLERVMGVPLDVLLMANAAAHEGDGAQEDHTAATARSVDVHA